MNPWQQFLDNQGARLDTAGHAHFAADKSPQSDSTTYLIPISYRGVLSVAGADAISFVQGQVTCDLRQLTEQRVLSGAQCTLKGRVVGNFQLATSGDNQLLLSLPQEVLPRLAEGLKKYSVFSKVEIADATDDWCLLGLMGPEAGELLARQSGLEIDSDDHFAVSEALVILRQTEDRYQCWVRSPQAEALWQSLAEHCQPAGSQYWQLADIRSGSAEVYGPTVEAYTPQALNLDITGAISFKKGCYTGQEVVARLHYKGTTKKRLSRLGLPRPAELSTLMGTALTDASGKKQGEIVMAAPSGADTAEALAVLPLDFAEPLHLEGTTQVVERLSLPYTLPEDNNS